MPRTIAENPAGAKGGSPGRPSGPSANRASGVFLAWLILQRHEHVAARRVEILRQLVLPVEDVVPSRPEEPLLTQLVARREIDQRVSVQSGIRSFVRRIETRAAPDNFGAH